MTQRRQPKDARNSLSDEDQSFEDDEKVLRNGKNVLCDDAEELHFAREATSDTGRRPATREASSDAVASSSDATQASMM